MTTADRPRGAVAIVTYNSSAHIGRCLDSIVRGSPGWEIAVADNASTDDTLRAVSAFPSVRLVAIGRNGGFAHGCNAAAAATSAPWVLFLNPDTVVPDGALDALLDCALARNARAAAPRINLADGQYQPGSANRRLPTFSFLLTESLLLHRVWSGNPWKRSNDLPGFDPAASGVIEQPLGAAVLVRRDCLDAIGGWDEQFAPMWFEDVDLAARLAAAGEIIAYCAGVTITHAGWHTLPLFSKTQILAVWNANLVRYANKRFGPARAGVMRRAATAGVLLRAGAHLLRPKTMRDGIGHLGLAARMLRSSQPADWYR
jgi:GT2 family glycosyltransferase